MKDIELKMIDVQAMDTKTMIEQNGGFVPAATAGSALIAAIPIIALAATVTLFTIQISYLLSNLFSNPEESPHTKKT